MRGWGPVFAHLFNIDEDVILERWTLERFRRYQSFARTLMKES